MREIVFDTETTGLNAGGGDRLVEIGCVELVNRVETGRVFHAYFNPERPMPPEAQAVHGLSDAFLADKPLFADVVDELLEFLGTDAKLVAHNAMFDFGFVDAELVRLKRLPLDRTRMIDTVAMARRMHPGAKHSLDALCTRYGIDRSHRVKHGALLDAELLAQLYVEMTGGRQIGLELGAQSATPDSSPMAAVGRAMADRKSFRPPRPHAATNEELARHGAFIASIKGALWDDRP
ncbi:DNA polymerase III subunit epsilon [Sphingomonas lacunae]|uniref:DNA polymerase III subunit epsilon n=1 Tax=Sphingomonas lacunae TaxID=2698828 RepID=A0A6M4ATW7_9SPHN|nr:DNA polymerase III subunit epsilon [Sphingomonas lacunae]QJQ31870.1 DNA polymerase III subunit epsilon [Sphingomonas lacunae]